MRKTVLTALTAIALLGSAAAVVAQQLPPPPGKKDAALVTGGTYALEAKHTQVLFAYRHFGFTDNMGLLSGGTEAGKQGTGTLTLDPKAPGSAKVSIELPVDTIRTTLPKLDEEFQGEKFFDAAKFPTAKFVSTSVKVDGTRAEVSGDLTIKGVTKPVVLDAAFDAAGTNPFNKKETVSFEATTTIKRSDFGIANLVPLVADEVELKIVAAFEKQ
jgi:polyisoprenoid-binding protein YceI